jgi:hypothetical protein
MAGRPADREADAMLEASERADQLLDEGDMAGAEAWHRILNAICREETNMDLTEDEADEIAAECVAALDYQLNQILNQIIGNPNTADMATADMIAAISPRKPATIRIIEAMKLEGHPREMKELRSPNRQQWGIVLLPVTCISIAQTLEDWGFREQAEQIGVAIDRANIAATGH